MISITAILIVVTIIAIVLVISLSFGDNGNERGNRYDDKVVEFVNGRPSLVDKRG